MNKSSILMLIKFFDQCVISKMLKKAKVFVNIFTTMLIIFSWVIFNIPLNFENTPSTTNMVCTSILYGLSLTLIIYLRETLIIILFPNEYFLMKSIKEYLGKLFKDFYLSDVNGDKIKKHVHTLSYYIANLYDLQRIKSKNVVFHKKVSILACDEFLYFINYKLKLDTHYTYSLTDLHSEQIADIIFDVFSTEIVISKELESDSDIHVELNAFLNSTFGRKFIDDTVIYTSSTFDDYNHDEWRLYNKLNLPVINHVSHYRRHIYDSDKKSYNEKHDKQKDSKKNEKEKSYLSWIDKI